MKTRSPLSYLSIALTALAFMFATSVYAEGPRDEMIHAYRLIKSADADYAGHRANAMEHLHQAGKALGLNLEGDAPEHEHQWQSDKKMTEARRLLKDAREKLETLDRDRAADTIQKAINELDAALRVR